MPKPRLSDPGLVLRLVEAALRTFLAVSGSALREVPTSVGKIALYDARFGGSGPTVVLLHGIAANSISWWPLVFGLRRTASRVLMMDHLGHGWSERPPVLRAEDLVTAVSEVLSLELSEPAYIVGNSLGGALAMHAVSAKPSLARSLILVSPAGAPWTAAEILDLRRVFSLTTRAAATAFVNRLHAAPIWYASLIAPELCRRFADPALQSLVAGFTPDQAVTTEQLAVLPSPSLLLWGKREQLLPNHSVDWFRSGWPGVVEEPEDWGHCPQLDRPLPLIRRVRRWIEEGR